MAAEQAAERWDAADEVTHQVLGHLDALDMNLVVLEDSPVLLDARSAPTVEDAVRIIKSSYGRAGIDIRMRKYAEDPIDAPFCK